MPLILIKTTEKKGLDLKIAQEITRVTMEVLGVMDSDVAVKFEEDDMCHIDLYLYDKKQYPYQNERTNDVFSSLESELLEAIRYITGEGYTLKTHLMPKDRCFRAGKPRF